MLRLAGSPVLTHASKACGALCLSARHVSQCSCVLCTAEVKAHMSSRPFPPTTVKPVLSPELITIPCRCTGLAPVSATERNLLCRTHMHAMLAHFRSPACNKHLRTSLVRLACCSGPGSHLARTNAVRRIRATGLRKIDLQTTGPLQTRRPAISDEYLYA